MSIINVVDRNGRGSTNQTNHKRYITVRIDSNILVKAHCRNIFRFNVIFVNKSRITCVNGYIFGYRIEIRFYRTAVFGRPFNFFFFDISVAEVFRGYRILRRTTFLYVFHVENFVAVFISYGTKRISQISYAVKIGYVRRIGKDNI